MGILGLTSFLNNSWFDEILTDYQLNNSFLLIDGYSLMHKIHSVFKLNSTYGGNYDEFAAKIDEIFYYFTECNIKPIVLLDGGRDKQDRKLSTTLKRANQRLQDASILNNCVNNEKKKIISKVNLETLINSGSYRIFNNLLPIMAFRIFIDMLNKFNFIHFQCDFEADYELVCLSNLMKCPLLSCDSDFYIYNLNYGYISLDHVEFQTQKKSEVIKIDQICMEVENDSQINQSSPSNYFLLTRIYFIDVFIDYFNLKYGNNKENCLRKEFLPIFAVLCGNDYVDKSTFDSLWKTFDANNNNLKLKRSKRTKSNNSKKKDASYNKILKWLSQFRNSNECLTTILNFVKIEKHELIRKIVYESVEEYMCNKPSSALFYKHLIMKHLFDEKNSTFEYKNNNLLINYDNTQIGEDFLGKFRDCVTTRFCLDVLIHRKVIFNCQIEFSDWPSTYLSSSMIRKWVYTILIKKFGHDSTKNNLIEVRELLRYQRQIKTFCIDLGDLTKIDLNELLSHDLIFKNLFDIKECISNKIAVKYTGMSQKLIHFFCAIFFWLNCKSEISNEFSLIKNENCIKAFIVSLIKSSLVDKCFTQIRNENNLVKLNLDSLSMLQYEQKPSESLLDKYFSMKEDESNCVYLNDLIKDILNNEINREYIKDIRMKLNSFSQSVLFNNNINASKINRLLNLKLVHCLCEFQSIYLSLSYAEEGFKLCQINDNGLIFKLLNIQLFFNGTFLHNFIEELDQRINPDLYIEELFGRKSFFKCLYNELLQLFKDIFKSEDTAAPSKTNNIIVTHVITKKQRKNMKKKEKRLGCVS